MFISKSPIIDVNKTSRNNSKESKSSVKSTKKKIQANNDSDNDGRNQKKNSNLSFPVKPPIAFCKVNNSILQANENIGLRFLDIHLYCNFLK